MVYGQEMNRLIQGMFQLLHADFVFAMHKGGENGFALKGGDANGESLKSLYDGPRPSETREYYIGYWWR